MKFHSIDGDKLLEVDHQIELILEHAKSCVCKRNSKLILGVDSHLVSNFSVFCDQCRRQSVGKTINSALSNWNAKNNQILTWIPPRLRTLAIVDYDLVQTHLKAFFLNQEVKS